MLLVIAVRLVRNRKTVPHIFQTRSLRLDMGRCLLYDPIIFEQMSYNGYKFAYDRDWGSTRVSILILRVAKPFGLLGVLVYQRFGACGNVRALKKETLCSSETFVSIDECRNPLRATWTCSPQVTSCGPRSL